MISTEILEQLNTTEERLIWHLNVDVREIFSTMIGANISLAKAAITETTFKDYVTAMVGFSGSYNGMISINTSQKLAMTFASLMLGMEVAEFDDDVRDALGEIANMTAGSFKHHFEKDGHEVRLSTPSVISGKECSMNVGSTPNALTLMFESNAEQFLVSVYLEASN